MAIKFDTSPGSYGRSDWRDIQEREAQQSENIMGGMRLPGIRSLARDSVQRALDDRRKANAASAYSSTAGGLTQQVATAPTPEYTVTSGAPAPTDSSTTPLDAASVMKQWEDIFGDTNRKALEGAQESLNSQIAANSSRQQEMAAMSGRSALGGGYSGASQQAALSAGAAQGQLQSNFYQRQQAQKQSFLQSQLNNAISSGQFDKAQQLQIIMAQLGLVTQTGELNAERDLLDNTKF